MPRFADNVLDQNNNAVPGVQVTVRNSLGALAALTNDAGSALANPISTDSLGMVAFNASSGSYTMEYRLNALASPFAIRSAVLGQTDASGVDFQALGTGAVIRSVRDDLRDRVTVKQFGAKGDAATADDTAVTAAIGATGQTAFLIGGAMTVPAGQYRLTGQLNSSQFWRVKGDGYMASFFVNGGTSTNAFFNMTGAFGYVDWEDFGVRGFKSFLKSTNNVETVSVRNLHVYNHTGFAFDVGGYLIQCRFDRLYVDGNGNAGSGGVRVSGSFNNVQFDSPQFNNLAEAAIDSSFSEGVIFNNMRVEGTNAPGKAAIKLAAGTKQHLIFKGGYFEGAHEYVLDWQASGSTIGAGTVEFDGTHFTFYVSGTPFKFNTPGRVVFRNCDFTIATRPPASALLEGYNTNLIQCGYQGTIRTANKRPAAVTGTGPYLQALLSFTRTDVSNSPANSTVLSGTLIYTASYADSGGGIVGLASRRYRVAVRGYAGNNLTVTVTADGADDGGTASADLIIEADPTVSAAGASVRARWVNFNPTTITTCTQSLRFDWDQGCTTAENTFAIASV